MTNRNATAYEVKTFEETAKPGAYRFYYHPDYPGEPIGIEHGCPCGCGNRSALFFRPDRYKGTNWTVTGEWPKVTAKPSIGIHGPNGEKYHWHGYLTNGVFTEG